MALDSKYGEIHVEKIPDDEPIFIIRAQDAAAIDALINYGRVAEVAGATIEFVTGVNQVINDFESWRGRHADRVKTPD